MVEFVKFFIWHSANLILHHYYIIAFDTFILFARRNDLRMISLDTPDFTNIAVPVTNVTGAVSVETFAETDSIFWADKFDHIISTAKINVSQVLRFIWEENNRSYS